MLKKIDRIDNNLIFKYLFIVFTILFNSVYFYQTTIPYIKYIIYILWQILLLALCINSFNKSMLVKKERNSNSYLFSFIIIFSVISLIILLGYYIYYSYPFSYVFEFVVDPVCIIVYLFCSSNCKKFNLSLFYIFENIMVILAIISLICYVLYYFRLNFNSTVMVNWGGNDFRKGFPYPGYFYINFFPTQNYSFFGLNMLRNTGIFVEAPTYSYLLYVALLINLFLSKGKGIIDYKLIILILTICSTLSTTGITLSIFSIFVFLFLHYKNFLLRCISLLFTPIIIYVIKLFLSEKRSAYSSSYYIYINSSYYVRKNNFSAFVKAWHKHLIFGNGLGNTSAIYKYINPLRLGYGGDNGLTSDFFELLAFGGIILILLYVIPTILSMFISPYVFCFAILNFIVFLIEGIMLYKIYIIILSFCVADYLWIRYKGNNHTIYS